MTTTKVARRTVAEDLSTILESSEASRLTTGLEATRSTGRPGYPIRALVGMTLVKSMYAIPTWTRTVALVREHPMLAAVIAPDGAVPTHWACYRFLSAPANRHSPCSHEGGLSSPRTTAGVLRSGTTGRTFRSEQAS
jgi:hypothetical protein